MELIQESTVNCTTISAPQGPWLSVRHPTRHIGTATHDEQGELGVEDEGIHVKEIKKEKGNEIHM